MRSLFILLLLVISITSYSQNYFVEGSIAGNNEKLISATTVILDAKDSTIVSFGLTNNDGYFKIQDLSSNSYLLQVTYLGFNQMTKEVSITNENINLGTLNLVPNSELIDEVEITADHVPMMVNKDTLMYNADAFQTQPNEVVEDLLKKLPGVEVESDGTIKAQGEEVNSVLVDGKKFFGDDPKIATRNIPADAVKTVQVFDKKSDMAEFSGVDDGEREKTINLELKANRKNGYFGSAEAGYGTDERYKGRLSLNRFNPTTQMSIIGNVNNVNEQGFTVGDYVSFMGGFGRGSRNNPVNIFNGLSNGFVTTKAGGFNLNHDFSDKTELSFNYFINVVDNDINGTTNRENFLRESNTFQTEELTSQLSQTNNHRINAVIEHEIDTTQDIKITTGIVFNNGSLFSGNTSEIIANSQLQNFSDSKYDTDGDNIDLRFSGVYRKKFGSVKKRILTLEGSYNNSTNELLGDLDSENLIYNEAQVIEEIILLQDIISDNSDNDYRITASFVEPLSYGKYLEFKYRRQNFNNDVSTEFYDILSTGNSLNSDLSNVYKRNYFFDRYSTALHINSDKSQLTLEGAVQASHLLGDLILDEVEIKKNVTRFLPRVNWRYELNNGQNIRLRYSTNVNVPSLTQLQPIADNSNPLSIYIGNPDLIPEYSHRLRLNYFLYDQFSFQSFFAFVNMSYTKNQITNASVVDENFVQVTSPVNVPYNFNTSGTVEFASPIKLFNLRTSIRNRVGYTNGFAFVNGIENKTNRLNGTIRLTFENRKKEFLDWRIGGSYTYNMNNFSESSRSNFNYSSQNLFGEFTYNHKNNWAISTEMDVNFYSAQQFGDQLIVPIWKASISKYLLKDQKGEIKLSVFDILNKNQGISRTEAFNYIENQEIISLGQYYMLSFIYALRGKSDSGASSGGRRGGKR